MVDILFSAMHVNWYIQHPLVMPLVIPLHFFSPHFQHFSPHTFPHTFHSDETIVIFWHPVPGAANLNDTTGSYPTPSPRNLTRLIQMPFAPSNISIII